MLESVGQLIVVAAPSCCGKTVFLAHLARGDISQLADVFDVDNVALWKIADAMALTELRVERIECPIVGYAIPTQEVVSRILIDPSPDERLNIVSLARQTLVTLLASSATLMSRLKNSYRSNFRRIFRDPWKYAKTRR